MKYIVWNEWSQGCVVFVPRLKMKSTAADWLPLVCERRWSLETSPVTCQTPVCSTARLLSANCPSAPLPQWYRSPKRRGNRLHKVAWVMGMRTSLNLASENNNRINTWRLSGWVRRVPPLATLSLGLIRLSLVCHVTCTLVYTFTSSCTCLRIIICPCYVPLSVFICTCYPPKLCLPVCTWCPHIYYNSIICSSVNLSSVPSHKPVSTLRPCPLKTSVPRWHGGASVTGTFSDLRRIFENFDWLQQQTDGRDAASAWFIVRQPRAITDLAPSRTSEKQLIRQTSIMAPTAIPPTEPSSRWREVRRTGSPDGG